MAISQDFVKIKLDYRSRHPVRITFLSLYYFLEINNCQKRGNILTWKDECPCLKDLKVFKEFGHFIYSTVSPWSF